MNYKKETIVYKEINGIKIELDLYQLDKGNKKPALVFIHGGGLMFGNREMLLQDQLEFYLKAGFHVISIDYRLAPETTLDEIILDVTDAYSWTANHPDVNEEKIVVVGHSAGGYLSLVCGYRCALKPAAIVSFYGYGDLNRQWCDHPAGGALGMMDFKDKSFLDLIGKKETSGHSFTGISDPRGLFYQYTRQNGSWMQKIAGNERVFRSQFSPIDHVTCDFPPTIFLHGDIDEDVPVEASIEMDAKLKEHKVLSKLVVLKNKGHIFDILPDQSLPGAPKGLQHPEVKSIFDQISSFLSSLFQLH